jgi:hypothetical protein
MVTTLFNWPHAAVLLSTAAANVGNKNLLMLYYPFIDAGPR